ncbi:Lrp/AsnC family transcriptional regulator [Candidatus Neomarinimicrobiota bacterium]
MLDIIDKKLIEELQIDGRQTTSELAEKVGMSVPAAAERIRKLQEHGIILRFTAIIDPKKVGMDVGAHIILISESSVHYQEVIELARAHPCVLECLSLTGEGSHLLVVRAENTSHLERLLGEIQSWPGVSRTESRFVMSSFKTDGKMPVAESAIKPPRGEH